MQAPVRFWIILALFTTAYSQPGALVDYHFDDEDLTTGPDTFAIYQSSKGSVRLSGSYRYSGLRSLEIRSVAGDSDFPELQGYFPVQEKGALAFQFALLVTNPREPINIALAGPAHFSRQKHGLALWLKVEQGVLKQVTAQKEEALLTLRPFVWYLVQCSYRIEAGEYDLEIREEYASEPVVSRKAQKNVMEEPGSRLDRYSFVSNPYGNNSNALFYVDDVRIATEANLKLAPFVAPGRRKLFVDRYNDLRKHLAAHTFCPPVSELADLGVTAVDARKLREEGSLEWLRHALRDEQEEIPAGFSDETQRRLTALAAWRRGCKLGALGDDDAALKLFEEASRLAPEAIVYEVSVLLAEARQNWAAANARWDRIERRWRGDIRSALISAQLGLARGDLDEAERVLREPAGSFGKDTEMIAEQYYYVLLWNSRYADARRYAASLAELLKEPGARSAPWLERAGDALFFERSYMPARELYEQSLKADPKNGSAYLKLSDVWFALGDPEKERFYREGMYGALK